jgi:hypothetical protein
MQEKMSQRTPRATTGRVFSSNLTSPGVSFAAALRGKAEEQQQPQRHQVAVVGPARMDPRVPATLPQSEQQTTCQSFRAPNVNSLALDKMLKVVVTVVHQIMTEFTGVVLEEAKILAITKNCLKYRGPIWPQEFIGPSKSQHLMRMA